MPENPDPNKRAHPARQPVVLSRKDKRRDQQGYAELRCKSNFSLLRGASFPEELVAQAYALGYDALAVTDRNTLAGAVRMHCAAKKCGLKLIIGAELTPGDAPPILAYAPDRKAYGKLARLITAGRLKAKKGHCHIAFEDIATCQRGLLAAVVASQDVCLVDDQTPFRRQLQRYRDLFGDRLYLAVSVHHGPTDRRYLATAEAISRATRIPLIATNDVHYHEPRRRFLQDVVTCIRHGCTLDEAGRHLFANAERHLKSAGDMRRLFADLPHAVAHAVELAGRCHFQLDELRYEYPECLCPHNHTPQAFLAELTWHGAQARYPTGIPDKVRRLIAHELKLIRELDYEPYFLTVWDIVRFARSRRILCQGRGSAANSAVCYCLGVTSVDPGRIDLLFERFVSAERNEPPDIDVDFEHERREEVFQYIYNKYGRDHAGIVGEVISYRPRSAVRDVGKVLGLSLDRVDALAKKHEWWNDEALPENAVREAGFDPSDRTLNMLDKLVRDILGFPRHLSQHVGGFVITRGPLCELVPIENAAMPDRTFIEWDKDDIDALGILKIDCLALGMLTAIRKCFDMVNTHELPTWGSHADRPGGARAYPLTLASVPEEDQQVYNMACRADTVGVFQIESRAQMTMLPRLRPRCFYDLVIEVAIVRPGPIQGGMVHPYLRRREGSEPVTYPNNAIRDVLHRTLGVPIFQEQAMKLAVVAAGFTPGEADQLRRAMGAWRKRGVIERFRERLVQGMMARGLPEEFAHRCFEQISGFGEYGFPESHAASFALLVYTSAWLKRYHPAAFCASLINAQPMGFYLPAQLVADARRHGVTVLPIDVNHSGYDCRLEQVPQATEKQPVQNRPARHRRRQADPNTWGRGGPAMRLGMRLVKGVSFQHVVGIESARLNGAFRSVAELARRSRASRAVLARLAAADTFRSMGLDRRQAVWDVLALGKDPPLLAEAEPAEVKPRLARMTKADRIYADYDAVGLSLEDHPISLLRRSLDEMGAKPASALARVANGRWVRTAGLVLVRQRPATAKGIIFCTLEDETGTANLIIRPSIYTRFRKEARSSVAVVVEGRIERQGDVVHLQTTKLQDLSDALWSLPGVSRDFH